MRVTDLSRQQAGEAADAIDALLRVEQATGGLYDGEPMTLRQKLAVADVLTALRAAENGRQSSPDDRQCVEPPRSMPG
jgi:hypothetical protein